MAANGALLSLQHRVRTAHPLAPRMRSDLRRLDRAPADEVRDFQERRLARLVRWAAARSPYYRSWFAEHRVDPREIRTLEDLTRLPLLTRDDLVTAPDRFRALPARLTWPAYSSGTSGSVVEVQRTPGSSTYELLALQRQWSWFGVRPGLRRLVLRAGGAGLDGDDAVAREIPGARQLAVSAYAVERVDPDRLLAAIRAFGPGTVEGWPSALTALAGILAGRGERLPVRAVITSSEMMTEAQRTLMRETYAAPVVDHYGQTERVTMAGSCEAGGYHVFEDYAVTELLAVPGGSGRHEIVGTPLHNWGFPLLRYRTGDTVGPAPDGACPCGRSFRSMGAVAGRVEDAFTSAAGHPVPLPAIAVDDVLGLREVQIAQLSPGRFEVRMVPLPGRDPGAAQSQVRANVDRFFGPGQDVSFVVTDRIPRGRSGKLKPAVIESTP